MEEKNITIIKGILDISNGQVEVATQSFTIKTSS